MISSLGMKALAVIIYFFVGIVLAPGFFSDPILYATALPISTTFLAVVSFRTKKLLWPVASYVAWWLPILIYGYLHPEFLMPPGLVIGLILSSTALIFPLVGMLFGWLVQQR